MLKKLSGECYSSSKQADTRILGSLVQVIDLDTQLMGTQVKQS